MMEEFFAENREGNPEKQQNAGEVRDFLQSQEEQVEQLVKVLPCLCKFEQSEQSDYTQSSDGGQRDLCKVDGVEHDFNGANYDDQEVKLVERVFQVQSRSIPFQFDHHLEQEHEVKDCVRHFHAILGHRTARIPIEGKDDKVGDYHKRDKHLVTW